MTLPDAGSLKWHGRNVEPAIMGNVDLPVQPPVDPMLAKAAEKVPDDPVQTSPFELGEPAQGKFTIGRRRREVYGRPGLGQCLFK